ncbi:GDP-mannose 4,6-dehydratase [Candidatus Saccharibacteria bacterium]|nr:GDP-mannose 4,6-dehydratase [Candidatus Saccharibacteria bacterium]
MADKILVTGINGFVGKHLTRALVDAGFKVDGIAREIESKSEIDRLVDEFIICDLTDQEQVGKLDLAPYQAVINLAGLANVGQSFEQPDLYMKVNVSVLSNICNRVSEQKLKTRILAISTGSVYDSMQPMPLTEDSKVANDVSPYTKSKMAMEDEAKKYKESGLDCIIVRPFNHIGPGQLQGFLVPDLIKQVLEAGEQDTPVKVGNLKTRRDYTDVRDVVKAYFLLATKELKFSTYNICTGRSIAGEEILNMIIDETGSSGLKVETDPSLIRPTDAHEIYGSYERLKKETGWQPLIPINQTIEDILSS